VCAPKADEVASLVEKSLLRATGVLCVYGSGFGMPAGDGFMRIVFLAAPDDLRDIYQLVADFTRDYLQRE